MLCPAGYESSPIVDAKGNPNVPPAECANAGSCTCGSPSGTASCSLQLHTYGKINCVEDKSSKALTTTFESEAVARRVRERHSPEHIGADLAGIYRSVASPR